MRHMSIGLGQLEWATVPCRRRVVNGDLLAWPFSGWLNVKHFGYTFAFPVVHNMNMIFSFASPSRLQVSLPGFYLLMNYVVSVHMTLIQNFLQSPLGLTFSVAPVIASTSVEVSSSTRDIESDVDVLTSLLFHLRARGMV